MRTTNYATFLGQPRMEIKKKDTVCPVIIGKTAQIIQTEVMTKKCQNDFAQTLSYNQINSAKGNTL